nr:MAG TPA: hypothetical protein [Caudoviricetes sp.]
MNHFIPILPIVKIKRFSNEFITNIPISHSDYL